MFKQVVHSLANFILKNISIAKLEGLLIRVLKHLNTRSDFFVSYVKRPKFAKDINFETQEIDFSDFAIILQGPVILEESFTVETVRLYRKNYPQSKIIISSWNDTDITEIKKLENEGAIVITDIKPEYGGVQNINYQITSTMNGLKAASIMNVKYAIKTRCDQRIYNPFYLMSIELLNKFPLIENKYGLVNRLIVCSISSLKYRPYGITDMFMIGYIEDMLTYWNSPLDLRKFKVPLEVTIKEYSKYEIAETYILASFLRRKKIELDYSLTQTWGVYKDIFLILDKGTFNIYWYKYSREKENKLDFYDENIYKELTFLESQILLRHLIPNEEFLDTKLIIYNP